MGDLITEEGDWNEPLIRSNFILTNAEDILAISLGRGFSKDEIIWDLEPKGSFTVKSVYHLAYCPGRELSFGVS